MDYIRMIGAVLEKFGENFGEAGAIMGLLFLLCFLLGIWYIVRWYTVRIYNWNGERYCYLGRALLHRDKGRYQVDLRERMADLSYTTLYQVCPSKQFVRKHRYQELVLCAGKSRCLMHVDGCMRQSVYYQRRRDFGIINFIGEKEYQVL